MLPAYRYRLAVVRILDGDTCEVDLDLGFYTRIRTKLRLSGINCPEMNTDAGKAAKAFTEDWIAAAGAIVAVTVRADKYGNRWNAILYGADGKTLNDALLAAGHAIAMRGGSSSPPPASTRQFAHPETP